MKQGTIVRQCLASVLLVGLLALTGCDGFWVPEPGHGGGTTGDYVYVAAAGGANKALDLSYSTSVSGGVLTVAFTPVAGLPIINAIEVVPLVADFSVSASPSSQTVGVSSSAPYTVQTTTLNGFNVPVPERE